MEKKAKRSATGRLLPGFVLNPQGRPAGSLNRFTNLKNVFLEAFYSDELEGAQGLREWAQKPENRTAFYKMIVQLCPKEPKMDIGYTLDHLHTAKDAIDLEKIQEQVRKLSKTKH